MTTPSTTGPPTASTVTVRYWAAARAAAGVDSEQLAGSTVAEVVAAAVVAHPDLDRVASVATFLLDGRAAGRDAALSPGASLEVLPPFAGG